MEIQKLREEQSKLKSIIQRLKKLEKNSEAFRKIQITQLKEPLHNLENMDNQLIYIVIINS